MDANMTLRIKVQELTDEIAGDVHHGECFYDEEMLSYFVNNLEKLKLVAREYFESNKSEDE